MSKYDYQRSQILEADRENSFYSLIMAAMRKADDVNIEKLKLVFSDTWQELNARYNAPGGKLENEQ